MLITEKLNLAALAPGYHWDERLKGFAVRVLANGKASYYVQYRTIDRKQRKHCIGPVGVLKAAQARARAEELIAAARLGRDVIGDARKPAATNPTVAELGARRLELHKPPQILKATWLGYRSIWTAHILPLLGAKKVAEITVDDIHALMAGTKSAGMSNVVVRCFSSALKACEKWGWRQRGSNPAEDVKKLWVPHRGRILSVEELRRLMVAIDEMKPTDSRPDLLDLIQLLLLTGLRLREWMNAEWPQIDWQFKVLRLSGTSHNKNKQRTIPLSEEALEILKPLRRPGARFIFPAACGTKPYGEPWFRFQRVFERAKIENFRIHDLRHTTATYGHVYGGLSGVDVQGLLGHTTMAMTSRYLNASGEMNRSASERASATILKFARP